MQNSYSRNDFFEVYSSQLIQAVTFSLPDRWRSLNPLKESLNHPKKVTLNHQVTVFVHCCFLTKKTKLSSPPNLLPIVPAPTSRSSQRPFAPSVPQHSSIGKVVVTSILNTSRKLSYCLKEKRTLIAGSG